MTIKCYKAGTLEKVNEIYDIIYELKQEQLELLLLQRDGYKEMFSLLNKLCVLLEVDISKQEASGTVVKKVGN